MRYLYSSMMRWWTAWALAASLALLGAAHAFERFGGLQPCNLCLKQREVLWAAVAVAGAATAWHLISRGSRGTSRLCAFLLAIIFVAAAVTAGFHVGGEQGWWALPAACAAGDPTAIDYSNLAGLLDGSVEAAPIVSCGDIPWSFAGLSMAAWNFVISIALAILSLLAAKRPKDARRPRK